MEEDSQISQQQETKTEVSDLDYVTCREIGREAVWSLSSAKPGNGVDQLRDESIETYWQSGAYSTHNNYVPMNTNANPTWFHFVVDLRFAPCRVRIVWKVGPKSLNYLVSVYTNHHKVHYKYVGVP